MAGENRVEALGIEIAVVDLMAGGFQALDRLPVEGSTIALFDGMRMKDENPHEASIKAARPGKR
jgi:hypothetical protein